MRLRWDAKNRKIVIIMPSLHGRGQYRGHMVTRLELLTVSAKPHWPAYMLAACAGIHPSAWSRYVNGQAIPLRHANRIAALFGMDRDELYGEPDESFVCRLAEVDVDVSRVPA